MINITTNFYFNESFCVPIHPSESREREKRESEIYCNRTKRTLKRAATKQVRKDSQLVHKKTSDSVCT